MRLLFTLFVLLFTQLFMNLANASPQSRVSAEQRKNHVSQAKLDERRKRKAVARTNKKANQQPATTHTKVTASHKHATTELVKHDKAGKKTRHQRDKELTSSRESKKHRHHKISQIADDDIPEVKEPYGRHRRGKKGKLAHEATMSAAHKKRYQHAQQTAVTKLMHQVGKPYRWGGTSPNTGFDCSGLVYYAYKDLIRIKMPRTANEMFHLRDAAPVKRAELKTGDLVFFRIARRGAADHVGVYLGNGKFIQSPRSGEDIKISYLGEDYWQDHYVGARRVMTPKTMR
jgi:murein DD-endopeptidase